MKFDENDPIFSEYGFLIEGQLFTKDYIDKIYSAGLNLISLENSNLVKEYYTFPNYAYSMNSVLKQNLIKSTFIFLFSNYEHDIFLFLRKYQHSKDGELPPNSNKLKDNIKLIEDLMKPQQLDYTSELSILENIRNALIHRNGKLRNYELILLKKKERKCNNENIFSIDEISLNISVNENIILYTYDIVGKFYEDLINKALNKI